MTGSLAIAPRPTSGAPPDTDLGHGAMRDRLCDVGIEPRAIVTSTGAAPFTMIVFGISDASAAGTMQWASIVRSGRRHAVAPRSIEVKLD
jgi:hypothetical protein